MLLTTGTIAVKHHGQSPVTHIMSAYGAVWVQSSLDPCGVVWLWSHIRQVIKAVGIWVKVLKNVACEIDHLE